MSFKHCSKLREQIVTIYLGLLVVIKIEYKILRYDRSNINY